MSKAALLIGINYIFDSQNRLNGCCNDVINMGNLLVSKFGFPKDKVTIIADTQSRYVPETFRESIIIKLYDFALKSWQENLEVAYFHFSGHGTQTPDVNKDEKDAYDEGICPSDFATNGIIIDDQLLKIFSQFNPKTTLILVFDCCHSGSIMDLPYEYSEESIKQLNHKLDTQLRIPKIIMLSGCMDSQTSEDAFNTQTRQFGGALSMCLLRVLQEEIVEVPQLYEKIINYVKQGGYSQRPILSSSFPIKSQTMLL